jgi:hypothetical protein
VLSAGWSNIMNEEVTKEQDMLKQWPVFIFSFASVCLQQKSQKNLL